ncbi:MAG TPA: hypothetical protein VI299_00610 [Polyangiales bacterium]
MAAAGCLIDSDRCDVHQVKLPGDFETCVCEPNAVFNASGVGCTPCAANEVVQNGACVCAEGFTRPSAGVACQPSAAGASCSASVPCGSDFPYCVGESGPNGYCSTPGCTKNADCPVNWTCEREGSTRYCRKPVSGLGLPCETSDQCAGYDANYCEIFVAHACILQGCAVKAVECPNEWICCDLTSLFAQPISFCIPPERTKNGSCPAGTLVSQ